MKPAVEACKVDASDGGWPSFSSKTGSINKSSKGAGWVMTEVKAGGGEGDNVI